MKGKYIKQQLIHISLSMMLHMNQDILQVIHLSLKERKTLKRFPGWSWNNRCNLMCARRSANAKPCNVSCEQGAWRWVQWTAITGCTFTLKKYASFMLPLVSRWPRARCSTPILRCRRRGVILSGNLHVLKASKRDCRTMSLPKSSAATIVIPWFEIRLPMLSCGHAADT